MNQIKLLFRTWAIAVPILLLVNPAWGQDVGMQNYDTYCIGCHSHRVLGAPKPDKSNDADRADWQARLVSTQSTDVRFSPK